MIVLSGIAFVLGVAAIAYRVFALVNPESF